MIIANLSSINNRQLYLKLIKYEIRKTIKAYSSLLKGIMSVFNEEQIEEAIDSINIVGKSIFCPTNGLNGQILRALEYGTNNNKSCHIISFSVKKVLKEVKGYEHVI